MAPPKEEITCMNLNELLKACFCLGGAKGNTAEALRKRLLQHHGIQGDDDDDDDDDDEPESASKRQKSSVAEYLICPITLELPFDPVTALDGQVYERAAIEEHFATKGPNGLVKSPTTGEAIGRQLLPAPRTRNIIEDLIASGIITGALAKAWAEKVCQQKKLVRMEKLVRKAEQGDIVSMFNVAACYDLGIEGFKRDEAKAFNWYKKLHDSGKHNASTAKVGEHLLKGLGGVATDRQKGGLSWLGDGERISPCGERVGRGIGSWYVRICYQCGRGQVLT